MVLCCAVTLPSASSRRTLMLAKRASLITTFFPLSLLLLELLLLFLLLSVAFSLFPSAFVSPCIFEFSLQFCHGPQVCDKPSELHLSAL